jgi:hypothetical protein
VCCHNYAKLPSEDATAAVNGINGLANQKISSPRDGEDLALAIQIVFQRKRPPCGGLSRLSFLLLFGFCQLPEALEFKG